MKKYSLKLELFYNQSCEKFKLPQPYCSKTKKQNMTSNLNAYIFSIKNKLTK